METLLVATIQVSTPHHQMDRIAWGSFREFFRTQGPARPFFFPWNSVRELSRPHTLPEDPRLEEKGAPTRHEPAGTRSLGQDARWIAL